MRSFADPLGKLPAPIPPPYEPKDAACPVDMVLIDGLRCPAPVERCKTWLPRLSVGQKIACAEFEEPSECSGARQKLRYCIDRYEYQPPGYGVPLTHVNYLEAQNLCLAMNKRLCMEAEWEFACEGPDALPYPYGYVRDAKRCNHDFPEEELVTAPEQFIDHRVAKDALPGCKSPFGVFNLVGNVDEWTTRDGAAPGHRAILRGGWWLIGRNRCRAATANHGERYAGVQTGLRCCKAAR
jgi:formylglycine-generating enzyme required for sulfatase activity